MKEKFIWFWDFYAYFYDTIAELSPYQSMLEQIILLVPDKALLLLDAGCGTGNLISLLKATRPNAQVEGIDFSPVMLRQAIKKNPDINIFQVDLNDIIPYKDQSFDVIVCINVLYAVHDPKITIDEFKRILKSDGVLIISVPKHKAKMFKIMKEHIYFAGILKSILLIFRLLMVFILNVFILRWGRQGEYHFLKKDEIEEMVGSSVIYSTFANQNWLVCFKKTTE